MDPLPEDKEYIDATPLLTHDIINDNNNDNIDSNNNDDVNDEEDRNRPSVLYGSAGHIIITEFCERLAYNAFAGSLVLFFQTQLNYTNEEADIQFSIWSGFCYVMPLLGGYIADTYLGRYHTILVFSLFYVLGLGLLVVGSIPDHVSSTFVFLAMYIIAVGTGGIKPNVCTLGADQFDDSYAKDRKEKESFFGWFYWSINLGTLIAFSVVAYICQYGIPDLGGEKWGFFVGFCIPTISMVAAVVVFIGGSRQYVVHKPSGSVLSKTIRICWEATLSRLSDLFQRPVCGEEKLTASSINRNNSLSQDKLSGARHFLDRAKKGFGGRYSTSQVESVKLVTRLIPFLGAMIPYWGIYSQMSTAFQNQACQMNLSAGGFEIPVSALQLFDTLAILMLVPVFDQIIYPQLEKSGAQVSLLTRMGWGFIFSMLGMLVAAGIESYRMDQAPPAGNYYDVAARNRISPCQNIDDYNPYQYQAWTGDPSESKPMYCWQTCDIYSVDSPLLNLTCIACDNIPQTSDVSVFWQIPQFVLIGVSEILASISALEFFYSQAPVALRSVTQSLNLATNALGTFIVIPLLLLVNSDPSHKWVPVDLDTGELAYYFVVLAGLMFLSLLYLIYISNGYEYKTKEELDAVDMESESGTDSLNNSKPKIKRGSDSFHSSSSNNSTGHITDINTPITPLKNPIPVNVPRSDSVSSSGSSRATYSIQIDSRATRGYSDVEYRRPSMQDEDLMVVDDCEIDINRLVYYNPLRPTA